MLNELESQNDAQIDGIMGKVRVLKDVCSKLPSQYRKQPRDPDYTRKQGRADKKRPLDDGSDR